jgi:hypothetical protein
MDALENFAGNEALGLRLDTVGDEGDFSEGLKSYGAGGRTEAQKALIVRFLQLTHSNPG